MKPEDATEVADAIVRVFIEHGDRTNRDKARLKYLLDAWGFDKFVADHRGNARLAACAHPRGLHQAAPALRPLAHIGVHAQKQPGESWIGVVLPSGKMTAAQMEGLARSRASSATAISA